MGDIADIVGSVAQLGGMFGDIAIGSSNLQYNKDLNAQQKNWAYADSRAANDMLYYYINNGSLSGYKPNNVGDYSDVANFLNPFMSLSGLELQQKAQKLSEDQFKYSKYVTENSAQIKAADFKKAGFSPLLAVGGSASYSPVGISSGGSSPYQSNRPNLSQVSTNMSVANAFNQLRLTDAQIKNIQADTKLKSNQANTETFRPEQIQTGIAKDKEEINKIQTGIAKDKEDIKKIQAETDLIKAKLKTEGYTSMLTQNQVEYVAQQIANLSWDYEMSQIYGTKTFEQLPLMYKEVQQVVQAIGVDLNSEMGQKLATLLFIGLAFAGSKIGSSKTSK